MERVVSDGKHLRAGSAPFRVKGVTYGTFLPRGDGARFPEPSRLEQDLVAMAACGFNTVRTYDVPPLDLLDGARALGLRLLVGLAYPDWRWQPLATRRSHRQVGTDARAAAAHALEVLAGRPEVLAISVGNEVPSDIARMYGRAAVEDTLSELVALVHAGDKDMLATYTGFPTAEYLRVDGQDLATFNVFLERPGPLAAYLKHLQRVTEGLPLVLTEVGLASALHDDEVQAASLDMQLRLVDESGCAGATIFSWTDEWATSAGRIEGWGFGLTREDRSPRPALDVATEWAGRTLRRLRTSWPSLSVVVCAYNEERRLGECLESLARLDYPHLQVLVCDDGSTDRTLEIAERSPFEVLALPHGGLSAARNAGLAAATGDIVAYLDADAACHPEWPYHLALAFEDPAVVVAGGPNLPFPDSGWVERAVALSPGNPVEVLVGDDRAEHVPGCNMAVRRTDLEDIGGFDTAYTAAGDDVDVCWRLMDGGGRIAFSAAAQVLHHRRDTVRRYLRQQRGYGRAERMLMGQHRHRFNRLGAARWAGVVYGGPRILPRILRPVVYHGPMGVAPFQTEQRDRAASVVTWAGAAVPMVVAAAALLLPLAVLSPLALTVPAVLLLLLVAYAACVAVAADVDAREPSPWRFRLLVGALHVLQPLARTWGRLRGHPLPAREIEPGPWTGSREQWLHALRRDLSSRWCAVRVGAPDQRWDLAVAVGPLLRCRLHTAVRWDWDPVVRRTWALTGFAKVALAVTVVGLVVVPMAGAMLACIVVGAALVEAAVLVRLCGGATERTTAAVEAFS
ncbi:glycosyltransferase [Nocardioides iriomotensis]|uniref:Glycosyltransferase n=1 Tax=Nocardioides iriomotensis TaxID=715784 RepID=A0A4Q5JAZ7_9ACTN|nr:glycosyltransferase [Nocardioides iriomotensis]RYU15101.1 glycosyltransferase [Nocardioides iriomotensis]